MPVRIRESIEQLPAYRPGKPAPADAHKLSSNENPFPPLPAVIEAITEAAESMNLYPVPDARSVRDALAEQHQIDANRILVTHGSVMGLQQLISAVTEPGSEIVYAWRSFEAYPLLVQMAGGTSVQVPLRDDCSHDLDAMADAVTERTRAVIVCSPNNPTGNIVTQAEFDAFVDRIPDDVLIMLDEAYIEFVREETVDGLAAQADRDNVVVLRTFSKAYGLAGLRVGYTIGDPRILAAASNAVAPFAVDSLAQRAAVAALDSAGEVFARAEAIADRALEIHSALSERGVWVPKPHGNFIWVATNERQTELVPEILERHRIVARQFPDGVRISIGTEQATEPVIAAAAEIAGSA
ncbi:MAG TPA: histidinol-phosphate transaminase [Candidatus Agrococcus pullicola]|uniref:Histidinol-phosphate aminotransferase n=1 Tax=Candidatus Agrococcus pullicola TaxID=2838429 RepID=A0A9D2CB84_9MICO|nr:histidinol-phosphate transaminase [Candidatus Agrococcus pullicola]